MTATWRGAAQLPLELPVAGRAEVDIEVEIEVEFVVVGVECEVCAMSSMIGRGGRKVMVSPHRSIAAAVC
jgi:hypothetical protein